MSKVLLIVADDVSANRFGAYRPFSPWPNPEPPPTPHLDALARSGVLFTEMHSNPTCGPTRATIVTGRYGIRTGMGQNCNPVANPGSPGLAFTETTIPEVLDEVRSGYFGKWALNPGPGIKGPNKQGFDDYLAGFLHTGPYWNWPRVDNGTESIEAGYATEVIADTCREWLMQYQHESTFAYVAFTAPHAPFHAPPSELLPESYPTPRTPVEMYDAMIVAMDRKIGDLLQHVDLHDTTVIFMSDNGTPKEVPHANENPRQLKGTLYRGGIVVPMIVAGAAVAPGREGTACHALCNTTDVFATVADILGAEAQAPEDSISLLPYLRADTSPLRDWVFSSRFNPNKPTVQPASYRYMMRTAEFKLTVSHEGNAFFNLREDPRETRDILPLPLSAKEAAALDSLQRALHGLLAEAAWRA